MNSYPVSLKQQFSYSRWLELYKNSPFRAIPLGLCPGVPLLAGTAFSGGAERSVQNCAEQVGPLAQLPVQL